MLPGGPPNLQGVLERLEHLITNRYALSGVIALASILAAYIVAFILERLLARLAAKTKSDIDDAIVERIHRRQDVGPAIEDVVVIQHYNKAYEFVAGTGVTQELVAGGALNVIQLLWNEQARLKR